MAGPHSCGKPHYPYKKIEESGYLYPIIKTELNYYTPLFYDDLMYIHTRPANMELVKLQFDYLITRADNGEICLHRLYQTLRSEHQGHPG